MSDAQQIAEDLAKQGWDMAQRVGMRIAALPLEKRETAFLTAEPALRELAQNLGVKPPGVDKFVALHIQVMRDIVLKIDVGGSPQGGKA